MIIAHKYLSNLKDRPAVSAWLIKWRVQRYEKHVLMCWDAIQRDAEKQEETPQPWRLDYFLSVLGRGERNILKISKSKRPRASGY